MKGVKRPTIVALLLSVMLLAGCFSGPLTTREKGVGLGTIVGAGLGAIIGSASGNAGAGAGIGSLIGLGAGALIGARRLVAAGAAQRARRSCIKWYLPISLLIVVIVALVFPAPGVHPPNSKPLVKSQHTSSPASLHCTAPLVALTPY